MPFVPLDALSTDQVLTEQLGQTAAGDGNLESVFAFAERVVLGFDDEFSERFGQVVRCREGKQDRVGEGAPDIRR